jgi:hypothetical protein
VNPGGRLIKHALTALVSRIFWVRAAAADSHDWGGVQELGPVMFADTENVFYRGLNSGASFAASTLTFCKDR